MFAVAGNGLAYKDYEKVARVCVQGVDQLWLPGHARTRRAVCDIFRVRLAEMALQRVERATWDGLGHEAHDGHRFLWACEKPTFSRGVKEYLDGFSAGMKEDSGTTSAAKGGSYWTSMWSEFLFSIAQEPGGPLRAMSGIEESMGWGGCFPV